MGSRSSVRRKGLASAAGALDDGCSTRGGCWERECAGPRRSRGSMQHPAGLSAARGCDGQQRRGSVTRGQGQATVEPGQKGRPPQLPEPRSFLHSREREVAVGPRRRRGIVLAFSFPAWPAALVALVFCLPGQSVGFTAQGGRRSLGSGDDMTSGAGTLRGDLRGDFAQLGSYSSTHQDEPMRCSNTKQGRVLVSDDRGFTCKRWDLNFRTGCCNSGNSTAQRIRASSKSLLVYPRSQGLASSTSGPFPGQYSCATCDLSKSCCSVYEYCVSCCLSPDRTSPRLATSVPRAQQPSAAPFSSVFEFCSTRCRHNSKSVVHENAYISELHHCFALPQTSHFAKGNPLSLAADVTVTVANQGISCDDACANAGMGCDPGYLPVINNCTVLRQNMGCKAGCRASTGPDQPAEVADSAPLKQLPGACLVNSKPALLSCSGFHENTRRLCPCRPVSSQ